MKLELLSLDIENFKAFRKFEFSPAGRSMDIFGRNHAGKTPLADAYFWLLFGRDTEGKSDWHILPEDENGQIIEGLVASVTGKFRKDGKDEFTLQRVYKQTYNRSRDENGVEHVITRNPTDFFIDGAPKLKKDYTAFVSGLCDEQTFAMLTDPDQFPGKMNWDARRKFLIQSFAPDVDDRQIINAHENLKPLMGYIGFKGVEEYAEKTKYEVQKIEKRLSEIPGLINEADRAKPADLPQPDDKAKLIQLSKQKIQLESQISAVRNGEAESDLRRQISEIQAQIADARAEYARRGMAGNAGVEAQAASLRSLIAEIERSNCGKSATMQVLTDKINRLDKEIGMLRKQWINADAQEFPESENICPTCGREYPPEKREQIEGDFNGKKAILLDRLEHEATEKKAEMEKARADLPAEKREIEQAKQTASDLQSRLDKLTAQIVTPAPFEETDRFVDLNKTLESTQVQLKSISIASDDHVAELQKQLFGISEQLNAIRERALNKSTVDRQNERIEELKKEETDLSIQKATHKKGLDLAEKFVQQKSQDIEAKVDGAFHLVHWKLFDYQKNGGIASCCEAYVQTEHGLRGYNRGAGTSERLNAGLDIINTLSHRIGVSVPLWIDNAEGVTDYEPVDTQVFRLYVSAADEKLRVEARE